MAVTASEMLGIIGDALKEHAQNEGFVEVLASDGTRFEFTSRDDLLAEYRYWKRQAAVEQREDSTTAGKYLNKPTFARPS